MDASEAVGLVHSGEVVGIGGMGLFRRPVGLVLELLRYGVRELTLLGWTLGFEADLLVGAGAARRVRTSYFGLESFGMAPMYRSRAEGAEISWVEETASTLAFGLRAALQGTGFMPARSLMGTDLLRLRPDIQLIACPYTGEVYPAMPALRPDVALIHALQADENGNCVLGANRAVDTELAVLARTTIVSAEVVVPGGRLPAGMAEIPGHVVQAVVPMTGGAWPTSCYPRYHVDGDELLDYLERCQAGQFSAYLSNLLITIRGRQAALAGQEEGGSYAE